MLDDTFQPRLPAVPQEEEKLVQNCGYSLAISNFTSILKEFKSESGPYPQFYHDMAVPAVTQFPPFASMDNGMFSPSSMSPISAISTEDINSDSRFRLPIWGICIMIIGYAVVFIFGVIGNCCVVIVVARLHRMKTVTNYFIMNLAISDLVVLTACLIPNLISNIFVPWILGYYICKTVPYIQGVSVCASVYSLVAISMERCISIQWPFVYQITKKKAKRIMVAIWIWSCMVALPWALFFQSGKFDPENPELEFCIEVWPDNYKSWSKYYFLIGNFVICYVLPLGIIFLCYMTIWLRVYRRPVPNDSNHKNMEIMHQKAKTAVVKMLLVVVLIFALSWLPLYCITLRMKFASSELSDFENEVIHIVYPIAQWLGTFNSSANPVVYGFLNKKFRHGFYMIFKCSWQNPEPNRPVVHKSPTVNILLRRMEAYKGRTSTLSNDSDDV